MSDDLHHLAAAYALDALDPDERAAFETHLDGCDACRRDLVDFGAVAGELAAATATSPPDDLRRRVLAEVNETRQATPLIHTTPLRGRRPHRRAVAVLAVAAAIVLIAASAVIVVGLRGSESELEPVLAAADAVTVSLEGDAASVRVVWSRELGRAALIADGLADPGSGLVYELWAIDDGGPTPAGLFTPDDGVVRTVLEVDAADPTSWGVTIEPEGGSPAPTGDILYSAET